MFPLQHSSAGCAVHKLSRTFLKKNPIRSFSPPILEDRKVTSFGHPPAHRRQNLAKEWGQQPPSTIHFHVPKFGDRTWGQGRENTGPQVSHMHTHTHTVDFLEVNCNDDVVVHAW